ncbi:MAG: NapC/NirT family cytochrome c [Pseudomonadales bacterium]|nr:NapC/NirT family cytochrome c [Pseudomonadales bacterium]MCP5213788.1 NapC/NirT family cytochrome c [Pseudomonadales bacterium]
MTCKIRASNELFHKALGSINTPEKFEAKRLMLAQHVWDKMKQTDSRECRNCHDYESMDYMEQGRRAVKQHIDGFEQGQTCIDCHKGIAHSLPDMKE